MLPVRPPRLGSTVRHGADPAVSSAADSANHSFHAADGISSTETGAAPRPMVTAQLRHNAFGVSCKPGAAGSLLRCEDGVHSRPVTADAPPDSMQPTVGASEVETDHSPLPSPDQIHERAVARLAAIGEEWAETIQREWSEALRD